MNEIFSSGMNFIILYTSVCNHPFYVSAYSLCSRFMPLACLAETYNYLISTIARPPAEQQFSSQKHRFFCPGFTEPQGHGASIPIGEVIPVLSFPSNA
jgi:hypothetical protein